MFKLSLNQILRLQSANILNLSYQNIKSIKPKCMTLYCVQNIHTNITPKVQHPTDFKNAEEEYLVRVQNDPDIFGLDNKYEEPDKDDLKEEEYLSNPPTFRNRLSTKQYADLIKDLIRSRKIKEAIDVVEVRMLKEDKVKPENYIYNLLLGACGRVGYTKKAFSLYNDMKRRALKITPGTYTALFNACANSPWLADGLSRAKHLHNIIIEQRYEPNDSNYNAMIKAYGRCGDLVTAFSLADEMDFKKFHIKDDTINFLFQACITEKEAGFRHALLVWRKIVDKRIEPSVFSYNLMLRCIRDCGMGDLDVTKDVIEKILLQPDQLSLSSGNCLSLQQNKIEKSEIIIKQQTNEIQQNRPNLMAKIPHLGDIISLEEVKKPEDRLLLVGGANSFLQNMSENKCTPDIKTFTLLLDCIPSTLSAEKELISAMKKNNTKPDLDFYNMLIKKRSMRFDYDAAHEVLHKIKMDKLLPNLITYGVLALGCKNKEQAASLLEEMEAANYRLNAEILGAMLHQACTHFNFSYVLMIMELCREKNIQPNEKFIEHLEELKKRSKLIANDREHKLGSSKKFQKSYQIFKMRYKTWQSEITVEEKVHPWQQFRQPVENDVMYYKNKETASRFKARHTSLFKQKTSVKYVDNFKSDKSKFIKGKRNKNLALKNRDES